MRSLITTVVLIYGILSPTYSQKPGKASGGVPTSQAVKALGSSGSSHGGHHGHQLQYAPNPYQGNYNSIGSSPTEKAKYPLLLSDTRQLNQDGTINFQYAADNGLQQGETVDPDGTRRGFYSYPGADGKPITVKYTAGKNGFIAEGAHLPKQPQVPAHSEKDEVAYKSGGGNGEYNRPSYSGGQHSSPYSRPQSSHVNHSPQHYSQPLPAPQQYAHSQGGPHQQFHQGPRFPQYSPQGSGFYGGGGDDFDFGPVNYGAPSHSSGHKPAHVAPAPAHPRPQQPYAGHASPPGNAHSAFNPYQQAGPAGPYQGDFDLGNGGQFSINFNPGAPQEVPIGGDFGGHLASQRY